MFFVIRIFSGIIRKTRSLQISDLSILPGPTPKQPSLNWAMV